MTFNPSMPHAVPLPWPAPWDSVRVVFDLYACEAFLDDEPMLLAAYRREGRALAARAAEVDALPDGPDKQDALEAWVTDHRAWRHAKTLAELAYYVLCVEWPDGTDGDGTAPATWERFPLRLLEWIANEGYAAARDALWTHPKAQPVPPPAAPSPSTPTAIPSAPSP